MLHVGMNIADKAVLFAQVRQALKPGGVLGVYDVMRERDGALAYPLPWAAGPQTNHLDSRATYARRLAVAGFEVVKQRSRRDFAVTFFRGCAPASRRVARRPSACISSWARRPPRRSPT